MDSRLIREKYFKFFEDRGHKSIDPAPLVLEGDSTTLFTSAGMQPLVPFLKGLRTHPGGGRLINSQPCFRSQDIEEVGDNRHITFFEMLGNWSLGDYFKKDQLTWVWEFLTEELELPKERLYISIYEGSNAVPEDSESLEIWKGLGVIDSHIYKYPGKKNWWSLSGTPETMTPGDIGGPDSEVFYEFTSVEHDSSYGEKCHPNCDCGRFLEIGNSVFLQFTKLEDGTLQELPNRNVDFGGGLERLVCATNDNPDIFEIDVYQPIIKDIENQHNVSYKKSTETDRSIRIVADHLRSSIALISSGVIPSNKMHGYILRRLIRRAVFHASLLSNGPISGSNLPYVHDNFIPYNFNGSGHSITKVISDESKRFVETLAKGLQLLEKAIASSEVDGTLAFNLYQTYGFPLELTLEIMHKKGLVFNEENKALFRNEFEKHKELSRTASAGMFKGGLASTGEIETKYHTATHLLHQALRTILGNEVIQRGSNITPERMRFDFSYNDKLTEEQLKQVEDLVNQKIQEDLPVTHVEMPKDQAEATGAIHAFGAKYGDKVTVYSIGSFSKEFCGGPHVENTGVLGHFKIDKEESAGSGIRRIYATLN